MTYKSIAKWPSTAGVSRSTDTHPTREAALAVCRLLDLHGFGGEGNVFPEHTRVIPVLAIGLPVYWTESSGGRIKHRWGTVVSFDEKQACIQPPTYDAARLLFIQLPGLKLEKPIHV